MTTLACWIVFALPALRFDLDEYSNIWASPKAALIFWVCFLVVVGLIAGLTLWVFRRMRPH